MPGRTSVKALFAACALAVAAALVLMGLTAGTAMIAEHGWGGSPLVGTLSASEAVPRTYLALYRQAAASCPGLPWSVLAAIGTVESANGTSRAPGVHGGANFAGAEGPMQFEPATFSQYAKPVPPGGLTPPSPYDPIDAVYAASRELCANGARGGTDLPGAVFSYNHAWWYVNEVLGLAARYQAAATPHS